MSCFSPFLSYSLLQLNFGREAALPPESIASPEAVAPPEVVAPSEAPTELMEVEPATSVTRREEDIIQQQPGAAMELEPLDTIAILRQTERTKKKRKSFDRKTNLMDERWLVTQSQQNPNIHCQASK